jgi:hypothetical protein
MMIRLRGKWSPTPGPASAMRQPEPNADVGIFFDVYAKRPLVRLGVDA